jgi:hypothetical protein
MLPRDRGDRRDDMHVAVFFLVNVAVALTVGAMSWFQGFGVGIIALRVIGTLIVLQAAYALWVIVITHLSPRETKRRAAPAAPAQDRTAQHQGSAEEAPRSAQ